MLLSVLQSRVAADERARIIAMEKEMRAERLGLKPKTRREPVGNNLVDHELELLKRGNIERDAKEMDSNRVDGLGAADAPTHHVRTLDLVCRCASPWLTLTCAAGSSRAEILRSCR